MVLLLGLLASPAPTLFAQWFVDRIVSTGAGATVDDIPTEDADEGLIGTWRGTYICSQGAAVGRLSISRGERPSTLSAILRFGPTASAQSIERGSYRLTGTVRAGVVTLTPASWIEKPPGYRMVGFRAGVPGAGDPLEGAVTGDSGCSRFSFASLSKRP